MLIKQACIHNISTAPLGELPFKQLHITPNKHMKQKIDIH